MQVKIFRPIFCGLGNFLKVVRGNKSGAISTSARPVRFFGTWKFFKVPARPVLEIAPATDTE